MRRWDRIIAAGVAVVVAVLLGGSLWVLGGHDTDTARREDVEQRATKEEQRADDLQATLDAERFARAVEQVAAAAARARLEGEVRVLVELLAQEGTTSPIPAPPPSGASGSPAAPDPGPSAVPAPTPGAPPPAAPPPAGPPPPPPEPSCTVELLGICI